ncbi:MAG: formate dehydrogenase [Anaerolineae bacterium]|nr:molybdopterin-dependent oxidoreductase [Anaerolineales bacterium]MCQ3977769.1 formate dehydrogenase [Anaerolineae bacterium]
MTNRLTRFLQAATDLTGQPQPAPATIAPSTPLPLQPSNLLTSYPPPHKWDDWTEYDPKAWPKKKSRHYMLIPTVCFNCESACGLLAYIDKETLEVQKFEGNPLHPGSRGRTCAKGPATLNQMTDPERILYPLKRAGRRGEGKWVRITWEEALNDIAGRMRRAIMEDRHNEIMYHVGRPGYDGTVERVIQSWGVDGHNSHTNVCSSSARLGYFLWSGFDRPSPDYAHARVILLVSSHLETGHYFNPHAQRIMEGKMDGAKLIVLDPRLSNTASLADHWLPVWPGSEAAVLLAVANYLIQNDLYDKDFVRRWVNWETYLKAERPTGEVTFDNFDRALKEIYAQFTPEFAAQESGLPAEQITEVAKIVAGCQGRLAAHIWRAAASGNLGGWQVARALFFLNVLTGSVGTRGGTSGNAWNKFVAAPFDTPPPQKKWNELLFPKEWPLAHYEMSFLLPHFLLEGRGKLDVYFTRVYNPVWTNPDGFTWLKALRDEALIGCHVALTPTWNESAWFADYVLPMGHAGERHDLMSQETHAGMWLAFRQPVRRVALEKMGQKVNFTYEANPGEVWEEDEFWLQLSWRLDPDGSLGIRQHFESPYTPGECITVEEYYRWIFENSVPGLVDAAAKEFMTPLEYMRKYGSFEVVRENYLPYEKPVFEQGSRGAGEQGRVSSPPSPSGRRAGGEGESLPENYTLDSENCILKDGQAVGILIDGQAKTGFDTPSRKLEFYQPVMAGWGWSGPEYTLPYYLKSHVHPDHINFAEGEMLLLPTFRLPTLIHTRSANSKWLYEISHKNPVWLHPEDARRLGVDTDDLIKVETEIGSFVSKVWVTEGLRPGIVAMSHHLGRWRLSDSGNLNPGASALVKLDETGSGEFSLRQLQGAKAYKSSDPDTSRIWWEDVGVPQNIIHAVHPDPVSGMHCWHQKVRVSRASPTDKHGDIHVDTNKSMQIYREWLALTRPAPGPSELRRPLWFKRPLKPDKETYYLKEVVQE